MKNDNLFEQLYKENYEKISRYCYFQLRNQQDTEDIVQETFIKAYDKLNTFEEKFEGAKTAWLYTISKNLIYDKYKSYYNRNFMNDTEMIDNHEHNSDMVEEVMSKDEYNTTLTMLDSLKPEQKEAIVLRYLQELEYSEIAQVMSRTENAVRLLISKGLKALRLEANDSNKKFAAFVPFFMPSFIYQNQQLIWNGISTKLNIIPTILTINSNNMIGLTNAATAASTNGASVGIFSTVATKVIIGVATAVVVAGGATYAIVNGNNSPKTQPVVAQSTQAPIVTTIEKTTIAPVTTTVAVTTPISTDKTYTDTLTKLSFVYPENYTVRPAKDINSQTSIDSSVKDARGNSYGISYFVPAAGMGGACDSSEMIYKPASVKVQGKIYNFHICQEISSGNIYMSPNDLFSLKINNQKVVFRISAKNQAMLDEQFKILESIKF